MNTKYKTTNPYMSESKNKLADLKAELEVANKHYKHCGIAIDQIKAEIKELEEALAPKQGDIYENFKTKQNYILARVEYNRYCLINLVNGERFTDPAPSPIEAFGGPGSHSVFVKTKSKGN